MWANPEFVPKWKIKDTSPEITSCTSTCIFPECQEIKKFISPKFDSLENYELAIGVKSSPEKPFLICSKHYAVLYRQLNTPQPCASCGVLPKQGTCFTRHSPDVIAINNLLSELNCDDNAVHLKESDCVCNACYRAHVAMLKTTEKDMCKSDNDTQLMHLIDTWKMALADENTTAVMKATLHAVLYVADEIMHERAVLLPSVSKVFLAAYTTDSETDSNVHVLEVGEGTVKYTTRWLLNQIILHLQSFITYKCIHRKFGTIIFRKGGDILTSLSWALGRMQLKDSEDGYIININQPCDSKSKANVLREAGDIVNDLIHAEITKRSSDQIYVQKDPHEVNIDEQISMVDPQLWTFLESATRTNRERNSSSNEERNANAKKLRRFYILCILMYCTNSQKPTMFHVFLADVVEMCGGSCTLIKILNQLGVVSSADTHDRFVTCVSEKQREKSV